LLKGQSSIGVIPWHIDFSGKGASLSLFILGRFFAQTLPFVKAHSSKLATSFRPNKMWDTETYEKETAPIVAGLDENEGSNQIMGKLYAY
jgi:hypothetical protein